MRVGGGELLADFTIVYVAASLHNSNYKLFHTSSVATSTVE